MEPMPLVLPHHAGSWGRLGGTAALLVGTSLASPRGVDPAVR
jgi:hypothetical protein